MISLLVSKPSSSHIGNYLPSSRAEDLNPRRSSEECETQSKRRREPSHDPDALQGVLVKVQRDDGPNQETQGDKKRYENADPVERGVIVIDNSSLFVVNLPSILFSFRGESASDGVEDMLVEPQERFGAYPALKAVVFSAWTNKREEVGLIVFGITWKPCACLAIR